MRKFNTKAIKLIADFMDLEYIPYELTDNNCGWWKKDTYSSNVSCINNPNYIGYNNLSLLYDQEYNWIMPVVEKIELLNLEIEEYNILEYFIVDSHRNSCTIFSGLKNADELIKSPYYYYDTRYGTDKLNAIYLAVVKFIEWYNKLKQVQR